MGAPGQHLADQLEAAHRLCPPTQVHPHETTVNAIHADLPDDFQNPIAASHQSFRHSFWRDRRRKAFAALKSTHMSEKRILRFEQCGSDSWVYQSKEPEPRYRIRANKCRDRICEACNRDKRTTISQNLARQLPNQYLRLLTLTLKSTDEPLEKQIQRLISSFRRLRHSAPMRKRIHGGIYFLELTINSATALWHPHLHCICTGLFLPVHTVRSQWLKITKDSFICDVRFIKNPAVAAGYITKYASKTINTAVWNSPDHLQEALIALQSVRSFQTFGNMKQLNLSKPPPDDAEWIPLKPLGEIIFEANRGDPTAVKILNEITYNFEPTTDLEETPRPPPIPT